MLTRKQANASWLSPFTLPASYSSLLLHPFHNNKLLPKYWQENCCEGVAEQIPLPCAGVQLIASSPPVQLRKSEKRSDDGHHERRASAHRGGADYERNPVVGSRSPGWFLSHGQTLRKREQCKHPVKNKDKPIPGHFSAALKPNCR